MPEINYTVGGKVQKTSKSDSNILIEEHSENGRTTVVVTAKTELELVNAQISKPWKMNSKTLIMANGYQSWTQTRAFKAGEKLNNLNHRPKLAEKLFHFKNYGSQAFWPMPSDKLIGFDWSYVTDPYVFIGSYNYKNAYLLIIFERNCDRITLKSDIEGKTLSAGTSFTVFDYYCGPEKDLYFNHLTPLTDKKIIGYTSWYNHYQNINSDLILNALEKTEGPYNLFQIDDGFETFVGDWLDVDKNKFPNGLEPIIKKIHDKGLMAGIWLSPFIAESKSRLVKEHPDWLALDKNGKEIYAGCNWSGQIPLDLNNKDAVQYIRDVLRHYKKIGFDFFKLDFLYATNLKRLNGKTRSETAEFAYSILREELEGKLILGCGATLSNGFGKFDYCRIGPDVSLIFDDVPYMRIFHPERISTKVTLLNTIFRSNLDGKAFLNDPDVFLLRDDNIKLSEEQRKSLTLINALFGSVLMTSDITSEYDEKKKHIFEQALDLFNNAKVTGFARDGEQIIINYELRGETKTLKYNMKKGTL